MAAPPLVEPPWANGFGASVHRGTGCGVEGDGGGIVGGAGGGASWGCSAPAWVSASASVTSIHDFECDFDF